MSLRVIARSPDGVRRDYPGGPAEDTYISRLVKLVPAEVVTVYPIVQQQALLVDREMLPLGDGPRIAIYIGAWTMLLIVIVLRYFATRRPGRGGQWGAVLIAAVAFVIWVHVMGGDFGTELLFEQSELTRAATEQSNNTLKAYVSNLALTAWTLLAPIVYRGDDR